MKHFALRPAILALLLVVLSPCAAAQEDPAAEDARYVWTGRVVEDGAPVRIETQLTPLEELAQIRLRVDVERDFEGALEALADLQLRATREGEGAMEALVQIAGERAELLRRLGRVREAQAALERLLVDADAARAHGARYELKLADAAARLAEVQQLLDPRLKAVRARLAAGEEQRGSAAGIEEAVRDALAMGNSQVVYDIGPRAVPALERMLLESPDAFPNVDWDPLRILLELSELRGAALIVEHWDAGGFFWKKRIVRAMERAEVLTNDGTWQDTGDSQVAPRLLETGWLPILARLVHDPEVGRDALPLVATVAFNDALSPELQTGLSLAVRSGDPDLVREALRALERTRGKRSTEAVATAALDHRDRDVRRFAAEHLLNFHPATALLAAAEHQDPLVRGFAAQALRGRVVEWPYYHSYYYAALDHRTRTVRPTIGERERALLVQLAGDPEATVRLEAVRSLVGAPADTVDVELWRRLAIDPDAAVRARSVWLRRSNPQEDAAVLLGFAADKTAGVLEDLDHRLYEVIDDSREAGQRIEPYLDVLAARRANGALAMGATLDDDELWDLYASAVKSDAGIRLVAGWALAEGDEHLVELLVREAPWRESDSWGSNVGVGCLADAQLAEVYARAFELPRKLFERAHKGALMLQPPRGDALASILVDDSRPWALRLHAAAAAAEGRAAGYGEKLVAFLRGAGGRDAEPSHLLSSIPQYLGEVERDELLLAVAADGEVPDSLGLSLFRNVGLRSSMDPRVAAAVVQRWFGAPQENRVVSRALLHLQVEPGDPLSQRLMDAVRRPEYCESALENLGRLGHVEFMETLGACLRADWIKDADERAEFQGMAVHALAGYLTDEAAVYLLDGLVWMRDEAVRAECFAALESIRRYQEERELWGRRKAEQMARDSALNELLAMIVDEDPDVRANAARSLAALEAVEHLPTVVRMLTDEHPMVRTAAQEALQSLGGGRVDASDE